MFTGDAHKDMETAKAIIGGRIEITALDLEKIASDAELPKWSRIAALYALGFARDADASAVATVRQILRNEKDEDIRAHATEAFKELTYG